MTTTQNHGIASIGIKIPSRALDVRELAELRGVDPNKYTLGLGCDQMALLGEGENVVTLATEAARRAISRWDGKLEDIGLVAVGTETAQDMSRALSAFVAEELGLQGNYRSYETKHACYGGTVALRQAIEWRASGASRGKAALVIAADVALYAPKDPGEPTQGAGAVAMIIEEPKIASVNLESYAYSEPHFDFWRPVKEDFPRVDGPLSLDCYNRSTHSCLGQWADEEFGGDIDKAIDTLDAFAFHVPFPKMVKKSVRYFGEQHGWDEAKTANFYESKVDPTMRWNRKTGNAYTAAVWLAVASSLAGMNQGQRIGAFSYGSGFSSELLVLDAGPDAKAGAWVHDFETDLKFREQIDKETYQAYRGA